jgi:hypothetical protein
LKLNALIECLSESLESKAVSHSSPVVALVRNTDAGVDSQEAWKVFPVIDVQKEDDQINLIMTSSKDHPSLTVAELSSLLNGLLPDCGEHNLFAAGDYEPVEGCEDWECRRDTPVIAAVRNSEMQMYGIMLWYEGCEMELD